MYIYVFDTIAVSGGMQDEMWTSIPACSEGIFIPNEAVFQLKSLDFTYMFTHFQNRNQDVT